MTKDLFGDEIDPVHEQQDLGVHYITVGRTCPECKRGLVTTESGWKSCPLGHGLLRAPEESTQLKLGKHAIPVWIPNPRRRV